MAFVRELHVRGKLSKSIGASSIALIPKKTRAGCLQYFRLISLTGSIHKTLAKVVASKLQTILPSIISFSRRLWSWETILVGALVVDKCIHSRRKDWELGLFLQIGLGSGLWQSRMGFPFIHVTPNGVWNQVEGMGPIVYFICNVFHSHQWISERDFPCSKRSQTKGSSIPFPLRRRWWGLEPHSCISRCRWS